MRVWICLWALCALPACGPSAPNEDAGSGPRDAPGLDVWLDPAIDAPGLDVGRNADVGPVPDAGPIPGDRDGDGVLDADDAFPDDAREHTDTDGDGVGNLADLDEDDDGVPDTTDELPFDPSGSTYPSTPHAEGPSSVDMPVVVSGSVPLRIVGSFSAAETDDHYLVHLEAGELVTILLRGADVRLGDLEVMRVMPYLPVVELELAPLEGGGVHDAFSMHARSEGDYVVSARVASGSPGTTGTYSIELVRDRDRDGVDDDRERARGMHAARPDGDDDDVFDHAGFWAPEDPDADGVPEWLDPDSDGDGLPDALEGTIDCDRDGLGAFVDPDSDGVSPADAAAAAGPIADTDEDGMPDFADADDDGDAVPDAVDTAPLVSAVPIPFGALATSANVDHVEGDADGTPVAGMAREGASAVVVGTGFGSSVSGITVLLAGEVAPFAITPTAVTPTEITFSVPLHARGPLRVLQGGRTSPPIELDVLPRAAPVLFPLTDAHVTTPVLTGLQLDRMRDVTIDGASGSFDDVTATSFTLGVGPSTPAGLVRAATALLTSNAVRVAPTARVSARVILPPGTSITTADLEVFAGATEDAGAPVIGSYPFDVARGVYDLNAVLPRAGGRPTLVLRRIGVTGSAGGNIDALSTAVAQVVEGDQIASQVSLATLPMALTRIAALPEVLAFRDALVTALVADIRAFDAPTPALTDAWLAAIVAAHTDIRAGITDGTLEARDLPRAVITPEQYDVSVVQREGTGHVTIENDTSLWMSARLVGTTGRVFVAHIDGYFDSRIIPTQNGLLSAFLAGSQDYDAPGYRNAHVTVLTPGLLPPVATTEREADVRFTLFLHTVIDRIVIPVLGAILDAGFELSPLAQILLGQHYEGLANVAALFRAGDVGGAIGEVFSILVRDFEGLGPITRFFGRQVGSVGEVVLRRFAERILVKLVPFAGTLEAALTAVGLAATATNVLVAVNDLDTTPGALEYDVDFGLEIAEIDPPRLARRFASRWITIRGSGFTEHGAPQVTLHDVGGAEPDVVIDVAPTEIRARGTELRVFVPGELIARARGPLEVSVRSGTETTDRPATLPIDTGLRLDAVRPASAPPGAAIGLDGIGFGEDADLVHVIFVEAGGSGAGEVEAALLRVRDDHAEVLVPDTVTLGVPFEVRVEVGAGSLRIASNVRPFNPQFPDLSDTDWLMSWDYTDCANPGCSCWRVRGSRTMTWSDVGDRWTFPGLPGRPGGTTSMAFETNPASDNYGCLFIGNDVLFDAGGGWFGVIDANVTRIRAVSSGMSDGESGPSCGQYYTGRLSFTRLR